MGSTIRRPDTAGLVLRLAAAAVAAVVGVVLLDQAA
jgi:hypothetical protein